MKIGIALSGGGVKGATHIGVLRALEENNIKIDAQYQKQHGSAGRENKTDTEFPGRAGPAP